MKTRKNDSEFGFTLIEVIITIVIIAVVAAMMTAYFGTGITQSSIPIFRLNATGKLNAVMEKISAQYSQYPHWQPNTTYAANTVILPSAQKRTGLLYTTSAGTTPNDLSAEPDWPKTMNGSVLKDGITYTAVWTSATTNGAASALVLEPWVATKGYSQNTIIYPTGNACQYLCTNCNGTLQSGAAQPTWSATCGGGAPIPDGALTWQQVGPAPPATTPVSTVVLQAAINTGCTAAGCENTTYGRYRIIDNRFIRFVNKNEDEGVGGNPLATTDPDYGKYLKVTIGLHSGDADADKTGTLTTLFVRR
jgi:prepilin-type N-terminal cleavage/methylation domain-containing protein